MTPADLAEIHVRSMVTPAPYSEADFAALLSAPGAILCGDAQGFALGRVTLDEAELLTIAVAPEARGNGQGRKWLDAFHSVAATAGARRAFLEVAVTNAPALALYRSAGWTEAGRRPDYYRRRDGCFDDALIFVRDLP